MVIQHRSFVQATPIDKVVRETKEVVDNLYCLIIDDLDAGDLVKSIQGKADSTKKFLDLQQGLEWQLDEILHSLSTSVLGPMIEVMGKDIDDLDSISEKAKLQIADATEIIRELGDE